MTKKPNKLQTKEEVIRSTSQKDLIQEGSEQPSAQHYYQKLEEIIN